jgi:hypothetical protein
VQQARRADLIALGSATLGTDTAAADIDPVGIGDTEPATAAVADTDFAAEADIGFAQGDIAPPPDIGSGAAPESAGMDIVLMEGIAALAAARREEPD